MNFDVEKMGKSERAFYENWRELQDLPDGEIMTLDLNNPQDLEIAKELGYDEVEAEIA
ncbi:hypothetical protein DCO58_11955 [Helicobacter saguini]|uniref:Uncharacterized protein n=1 Tax=Helicobacter saguini TaxID=1548018 RepID=A0A6B0HP08_9HELI|nr:hypothetical protein [Helicobacter saguini]MWV60997.1 hypothetical protein [Helicobacter saguini]MWV68334.1 hypothetical protein [Helicobacter saguini]MWV70201.1 hypothetical protein [Helicobacter saguini]MWV72104.1 hypothetical protein [Helicobacter saguini]